MPSSSWFVLSSLIFERVSISLAASLAFKQDTQGVDLHS